VDVLACYNPFDKLDISKLKQLKWIQLTSVGIDQLPKHEAKEQGIVVTKTGQAIQSRWGNG
jgi:phosphoglycerate dehydrogenase-like enzyme